MSDRGSNLALGAFPTRYPVRDFRVSQFTTPASTLHVLTQRAGVGRTPNCSSCPLSVSTGGATDLRFGTCAAEFLAEVLDAGAVGDTLQFFERVPFVSEVGFERIDGVVGKAERFGVRH